jgi:hypothetical protein
MTEQTATCDICQKPFQTFNDGLFFSHKPYLNSEKYTEKTVDGVTRYCRQFCPQHMKESHKAWHRELAVYHQEMAMEQ